MMKCQDYIYRLSSGQLAHAGPMTRFWAAQHRLMCRRCRAFTANDLRLDAVLQAYREHLRTLPDA